MAKEPAAAKTCGGCRWFRPVPVDGTGECFALPPQQKAPGKVGTGRPVCHEDDPECSLHKKL